MKKIMVSVLALSMLTLTACSSSNTTSTATATATATASPEVITPITVDNDKSTFAYAADSDTATGFNISNGLTTPSNLVVASDTYLYYVKADSSGLTHLYRSDKDGKNESILIDNCGGNVNLIGNYIVYSGQDLYDVYKYNLTTKAITRIFIGVYDSVYVAGDKIYLVNSLMGIISCDMSGNNYKVISKKNSFIAGYDGGYIYYTYYDSLTGVYSLNKTKLGDTASEVVISIESLTPALVMNGMVLCITTDTDTSSYVFKLYSLSEKKFTDTVISFNPNKYGFNSFSMTGTAIYFSLNETVEDNEATATAKVSATASATATTATKEVNNLYVYDIKTKKTYLLGETTNYVISLAGKDVYLIDGNANSSSVYTDIISLDKLVIKGNALTEQTIY